MPFCAFRGKAWCISLEELIIKQDINQAERFKDLAKSKSFVLGCALITVGTIGSFLAYVTWQTVLGTAIAMIHITALWIIVAESLLSSFHIKTLFALSMFRLSAKLSIVVISIGLGTAMLGLLFSFMNGLLFLIFFAVIGGIGYVIIKYYLLALLKVLDSIRDRLEADKLNDLTGLGSFLVMSYVIIGISIISILLLFIIPNYSEAIFVWDYDYQTFVQEVVFVDTNPGWEALFTVANSVGMLLCLRTLKKFDF